MTSDTPYFVDKDLDRDGSCNCDYCVFGDDGVSKYDHASNDFDFYAGGDSTVLSRTVDDDGKPAIRDMEQLSSSSSRYDNQRLLPKPVHDQRLGLYFWYHGGPIQSTCMSELLYYCCYKMAASSKQLHCVLSEVCKDSLHYLNLADILAFSSYTFAANASAPLTRPAESGTCYTNLPTSGAAILMTQYGNESVSQTFSLPITTNGMQAYAIPFDGIATGTVPPITAAPTAASTTSVAASTYTVSLSSISWPF
jgi:hypothetical protein